jgi:hypothetical protein
VRQDISDIAVSDEMTSEEENGGRRHTEPTPNELGKGQEEEDIYI